ncbi:MAG: phosphatidylglycerophosphatase A [Pseudomonadota bacterium]
MPPRNHRELVRAVLRDPIHWLAFAIPAGLSPVAPGTVGSLWGIPLAMAVVGLPLAVQLAIGAIGFAIGIAICGVSSRRLGVHDHGGIVWDEVIGCYLALLPAAGEPLWLAAGFGLFRLFDIVKPRPIRDLDHRLHGGLGIMLDDVVAALYAALSLVVVQRLSALV